MVGDERAGGLLGEAYRAQVTNCHSSATVTSRIYAGGLTGVNQYGTIQDSYATGDVSATEQPAGGLVGYNLSGSLLNCHAEGQVTSVMGQAGGLVGLDYTAFISNCYATGNVTQTGEGKDTGGLVGNHNNGKIVKSYATGAVSGTENVGGLVGIHHWGTVSGSYAIGAVSGTTRAGGLSGTQNNGLTSNSYATGAVTSVGDYAGGLIGYLYEGAAISSYATGNVSAPDGYSVGGLAGRLKGAVYNTYATGNAHGFADIGGLIGRGDTSYVINSYSTGTPSNKFGDIYGVGGLIGYGEAMITNSFWDSEATGITASTGGTGLTTSEMKDPATFISAGWGFYNDSSPSSNEYWIAPAPGEYMQLYLLSPAYVPPFAGAGTSDDPYQIYTKLDLERVNYDLAASYALMNDIDLAAATYDKAVIATHVATSQAAPSLLFVGSFDGNGHVIRNLTIDNAAAHCLGLFGGIGDAAVVTDLGVENVDITGADNCGGLAGYVRAGRVAVAPTISDCYVTGTITANKQSGGFVGVLTMGTVRDSYATVTAFTAWRSGGFVGYIGADSIVSDSYATGDVTPSGAVAADNQRIGGFAGHVTGNAQLSGCYATGNVGPGNWGLGGFVGTIDGVDSVATVIGCKASGNIEILPGNASGSSGGGGFGGKIYGANVENCSASGKVQCGYLAGGFVGQITTASTVRNCSSTGAVNDLRTITSADRYIGGFAGDIQNCVIENSYATGAH